MIFFVIVQKTMKIIFPDLTYNNEVPLLINSAKMQKSISGIQTILNRLGYYTNADELFKNNPDDYASALAKIENTIKLLIDDYKKSKSDDKLLAIFHHIHFWGGITGRNIYIRNGGFENNFNIDTYKKIVEKTIHLKQQTLNEDLKQIADWFMSIPQLGVAFGTKHLRFWSINANENKIELPVLDSILAIRLLYKCNPTWKDYYSYVKQMQDEAKNRNITVTKLERGLYNEFN